MEETKKRTRIQRESIPREERESARERESPGKKIGRVRAVDLCCFLGTLVNAAWEVSVANNVCVFGRFLRTWAFRRRKMKKRKKEQRSIWKERNVEKERKRKPVSFFLCVLFWSVRGGAFGIGGTERYKIHILPLEVQAQFLDLGEGGLAFWARCACVSFMWLTMLTMWSLCLTGGFFPAAERGSGVGKGGVFRPSWVIDVWISQEMRVDCKGQVISDQCCLERMKFRGCAGLIIRARAQSAIGLIGFSAMRKRKVLCQGGFAPGPGPKWQPLFFHSTQSTFIDVNWWAIFSFQSRKKRWGWKKRKSLKKKKKQQKISLKKKKKNKCLFWLEIRKRKKRVGANDCFLLDRVSFLIKSPSRHSQHCHAFRIFLLGAWVALGTCFCFFFPGRTGWTRLLERHWTRHKKWWAASVDRCSPMDEERKILRYDGTNNMGPYALWHGLFVMLRCVRVCPFAVGMQWKRWGRKEQGWVASVSCVCAGRGRYKMCSRLSFLLSAAALCVNNVAFLGQSF